MRPDIAFINHVLDQHPSARARLKAHAGATIRIDAPPFAFAFQVRADGGLDGADGGANDATAPDLILRLDPATLPLWLADREAARKQVRIEGDAGLASAVDALLREVRWDVEEDMSRLIGDVAAHRLGEAGRTLAAWGAEAARRLAGSTSAYFTDEAPLLARRDEFEALREGIARTRDDVERAEKRLAALEARQNQEKR